MFYYTIGGVFYCLYAVYFEYINPLLNPRSEEDLLKSAYKALFLFGDFKEQIIGDVREMQLCENRSIFWFWKEVMRTIWGRIYGIPNL